VGIFLNVICLAKGLAKRVGRAKQISEGDEDRNSTGANYGKPKGGITA
jgi:hypothetical protein